jgi:DtxR family transcriptional regulator, Mn-dependent transcriptional regulator
MTPVTPDSPKPISRMVEDYVTNVWKAEEWGGTATTNELAGILGVTPSTVSSNLKKLARDGLIDYEPYGRITLTEAGRTIAVPVVRRHRIIETYLVERLGLGWDEVHPEADALEHAVSDAVLARMDAALGHPTHDPHGDPIPAVDGTVTATEAVTLASLPAGSGGLVVRISDREPGILRYLAAREVGIGTELRVEAANAAAGALRITRGHDSVEIATGAASAVWVAPA